MEINRKERKGYMIDHRSYTQNLSQHEMKWKRSKIVCKYINKTHNKIVKRKSGWTYNRYNQT